MKRKYIKLLFFYISQIILFNTLIFPWFFLNSQLNQNYYQKNEIPSNQMFLNNKAWMNNGTAICTSSGGQTYQDIISDGAGGAIIAWQDTRNALYCAIYAQRIDSTGNVLWTTNGVTICSADAAYGVDLCTDGTQGGAILTWMDWRSGNNDYDIYVQKIDSTGSIQWTSNGIRICNANGIQNKPQICTDMNGGAIIVWQDYRGGIPDIYAQRINSAGTAQWTADGVAICTATNEQFYPVICSDGLGGAIIIWPDNRTGNKDIYAQRINAAGTTLWGTNGISICSSIGNQTKPQLVCDGMGGAIITWEDGRGVDEDIYAQRINSSGDVQWATNGLLICNASHDNYDPQICRSDDRSVIIVWHDTRTFNSNIYAQLVSFSGEILWNQNGNPICITATGEGNPYIVSDGVGGAIISWNTLGATYDLYAQHIGRDGNVLWTPNGVEICTADNTQKRAFICRDGGEGAIISWLDGRDEPSNFDVYAYRIEGPTTPTLDPISPNPDLNGNIQLKWSTCNNTSQYYVYRDTSIIESVADMTPIATVSVTEYNDTISEEETYYYVIVAKDSIGNSSISNCENVTVYIYSYNGPEIVDVAHAPFLPDSFDTITINVNVNDACYDIENVSVWYKENSNQWQQKTMSGGSQYSTTIGPFNQGSLIKYYIEANNSKGYVSKSPAYAPNQFHVIEIEGETPTWKKLIKGEMLGLKNDIISSIDATISIASEIISTTWNDSVSFFINQIMKKVINGLGKRTFALLNKEEIQHYATFMGNPKNVNDYIALFWEWAQEDPAVGGLLTAFEMFQSNVFTDPLTNNFQISSSHVSNLLKNDPTVEQILHYQVKIDQINQIYDNFITWINGISDNSPPFDVKEILFIIESIKSDVYQGIFGNVAKIITPDGSIYPAYSIKNLKDSFDLVHAALEIGKTVEQVLDYITIGAGIVSFVTTATGVGAPIGVAAGSVFAGAEVAQKGVKTAKIASILIEAFDSALSIRNLMDQLEKYIEIFDKSVDFVQDEYGSPTNYQDMKLEILNTNSPSTWPVSSFSVGMGNLTIKNTGSVAGNAVVLVTIRAPAVFGMEAYYKPLYCYYLTRYLNPGEQYTFTTYYFGEISDVFGLFPYIIDFKAYMNGKFLAHEIDDFYVGAAGSIDLAANMINDIGNFVMEQGQNTWKEISTSVGDVWSSIWGGDAQSDIDLRLWDENKTTLLVGVNYTTNETVNLIGADYSGNTANPEYIRIYNPNGTKYCLEIIGIDLLQKENTSVMYINTGNRTEMLGTVDKINLTCLFTPDSSGNVTVSVPLLESGNQSAIDNLKINSTNLTYLGKSLNLTEDIVGINLTAGEAQVHQLNFSHDIDAIEGNYTGKIEIWNETHLLKEINVTIEMINESSIIPLEFSFVPSISSPVASNESPLQNANIEIRVTVTDDQQIEKVFLLYASNSPKSWNIIEMSVVGNNEYLAIIPGQSGGTVLYYQIYAFDNDSHLKIEDNNGNYYVIEYQTPSFPSLSPLFIFIILGVIAICVAGTSVGFLKFRKRKKRIEKQNEKFETKFVKPDLEEDEPTSAPN